MWNSWLNDSLNSCGHSNNTLYFKKKNCDVLKNTHSVVVWKRGYNDIDNLSSVISKTFFYAIFAPVPVKPNYVFHRSIDLVQLIFDKSSN